jgi:hypothetical protein
MRRREFLGVIGGAAAVAWPLAARTQESARMRRVGVLIPGASDDPVFQARLAAFLEGLRQLGWVDGHNVRIDNRAFGTLHDPLPLPAYRGDRLAFAPHTAGLWPDCSMSA